MADFYATYPASDTTITGTITVTQGTTPWVTDQTTAAVTWQAEGSALYSAITNAFTTVFTAGGALVWLGCRNNTNGTIAVSMDGGTTTNFVLDPGDAFDLDLKPQGKSIAAAQTVKIKYTSAPTSGTFRVNGYY